LRCGNGFYCAFDGNWNMVAPSGIFFPELLGAAIRIGMVRADAIAFALS